MEGLIPEDRKESWTLYLYLYNRYPIELLNDSIDRSRADSPTADERIDRLRACLHSELTSWEEAPDSSKVVSLPLDSYQLEGLRRGIRRQSKSPTGTGGNDS